MSTESPIAPDLEHADLHARFIAPQLHTRPDSVQSFLAELLADQQRLQTPAARAAAVHDAQPAAFRGNRFRDLIPLSAPGPGEQYAFEVDLDACSGCKACVAGCHSLNGLDEQETWRDVGLVLGGSPAHPFQQTVTTACHHCADPACLNGCPVLAYEKDPVTGIVRHLDDQCIGCSYCVLKCPYDVPKYNERLGIVRKCDMCQGRLADGEAPACVQACPTQAIKIVTVPVPTSEIPNLKSQIIGLAADAAYTRPTTRYLSSRELPTDLRAADVDTLRPQHTHLALVVLLVGTQLGLGLLLASLAGSQISNLKSQILPLTGLALYATALLASVFHLGQPTRAWRVFLGLRRSWLSREAVVLGAAFAPLLLFAANQVIVLPASLSALSQTAGSVGLILCFIGVMCSAMLYIDTRRHFWRPSQSFGRMLGTVIVAAFAGLDLVTTETSAWSTLTAVALAAKLVLELTTLQGPSHSARLQRGPLRLLLTGRLFAGGCALLLFAAHSPLLGFLYFALGELLERALFFRAVDAPKMPGMPASQIKNH